MRLRVHDTGRLVYEKRPVPGISWEEFGTERWLTDAQVYGPGWHEAIVLTATDADAQRLAEAIAVVRQETPKVLYARDALDRLAAGIESDHD